MFLHHLNEEQRRAVVIFAYCVMAADHEVADEEMAIIHALEHELDLTDDISPVELLLHEPPFALFSDRRSRIALMLKLYAIALADGRFHPLEQRLLEEYGDKLGLTGEDMARLEDWARRHTRLVNDAIQLVEG